MSKWVEALREGLADYAHAAWSGWMRYMFENSVHNEDGSVTIPRGLVERWTRQMNTDYPALPEPEKKSDRAEADRMLTIFGAVQPTLTVDPERVAQKRRTGIYVRAKLGDEWGNFDIAHLDRYSLRTWMRDFAGAASRPEATVLLLLGHLQT